MNQHESVARNARYTQHIRDLCKAFHVLHELQLMDPSNASAGYRTFFHGQSIEVRVATIHTAPVTDETTYAVALHELGHLLHPLGMVDRTEGSQQLRETGLPSSLRDVRLGLEAERAAWEWAHAYALEWTEVMTFVETYAMRTYLEWAQKY